MKSTKSILLTILTVVLIFSAQAQKQKDTDKGKTNDPKTNTTAEKILKTAYDNMGVPYKYAGRDPETGFDCSGFVHYVHKQHGINLPVRSVDYKQVGTEVPRKDARPGDIILFAGRNAESTPVGHVGIITEATDKEILFIHSATSANRGIVVSRLSIGYYKNRFAGIRRIDYDSY